MFIDSFFDAGISKTLVRVVSALLALILIRGFAVVIYNLFFHPLAAFPGPKLAAATRSYFVTYSIKGTLQYKVLELHRKYGSVIRIAPDELVFNSPEAWKDIYGTRAGKPEMRKDPGFFQQTNAGSKQGSNVGIFASSRERHGPLRRLISHGFSEKALREQEPVLQHYCDMFLKGIHERCKDGTNPINMVQWFNFFTFDVIGDLTFAESFGCLETGEYHPWIASIFTTLKLSSFLRAVSYYPSLFKAFQLIIMSALKGRRGKLAASIEEKIRHRQNTKTDRADFLSAFLEDGADASFGEMLATARTLIIAGSETTATLLAGLTYLLLKNPAVLKKLTEEVRSSFQSEAEITMIGVNKLTYMLACLDEAMRVYPPVPSALPRNVPAGGDKIGDVWVPENTVVAVTHLAAYYDEANFAHPYDFIPERWLGDKRFKKDKKAAHQPFSVGPRNCVGKNLAYVEMRLALARLLWNFDLVKLDPGSENWADQKIFALWQKEPLLVYLKPIREKAAWLA